MLYISFTSDWRTAQLQTLLILRLRLLNTASYQTTPRFGVMQISTLVSKGELSSLPVLLPAETGQRQVWQVITQLSAHWKSPKFWGFDHTVCELLSLRLREKFITDWEDWRHSRNLAVYPPPKQHQLYLWFFMTVIFSNLSSKVFKVGSKAAYFLAGHYTSLSF